MVKNNKQRVLSWLLEENNSSVRYLTLKDVLNRGKDDPELKTAKALISHSKIITKIFSKIFTRSEIKNFIALTNVVVLPFKLVPSDNPLSILEVMAQGKTVISTKLDGIPELLENGKGYLINPNDPKDLASAISTLYSNPQLRKNYEKKARGYMQSYPGWDYTTHEIIKLVNDLL